VAFAVANVLLLVVMQFNGTAVLAEGSYVRFDSGHYMGIATSGYELFPCNPARYPPGSWCGNTAWFPGYPFLIRLLLPLTEGRSGIAGVVLSRLFLLGTLLVLAVILKEQFGARRTLPVLLAAALFPGAIYYQVVFPISMFLFFTLLHMYLLVKRRDVLAGLTGALAVLSYSTGYTLAAVSGLYLLLTWQSLGTFIRRALLVPGVTMLGVLAVFLIHQYTVGTWNAWFLVQAKYGFDPGRPLFSLAHVLGLVGRQRFGDVVPVQNLLVLAMLVIAGIELGVRREWSDATKLFFTYGCVFFAMPVLLVGGRLGYYRTFSVLLPAVVLMARWPDRVVTGFVTAFAILFPLLSMMFFNSQIV
jgi:hypothetical protein